METRIRYKKYANNISCRCTRNWSNWSKARTNCYICYFWNVGVSMLVLIFLYFDVNTEAKLSDDDAFHTCIDLIATIYNILENGVHNISIDRWRNFPVYRVFDYNPSGNDSTSGVAWTFFARQLIYVKKI